MKIRIIVVIVILAIIAITLGGFSYYQHQIKLQKTNFDNVLYNFSVNDDGSSTTTLTCPVGRVIEVVDAHYEAYDPNLQSATNPLPCSPAISDNGNLIWPSGCPTTGCSDTNDTTPSDAWELTTDKDGNPTYRNIYCGYDSDGNPTSTSSKVSLSMNALGYLSNAVNGQQKVTISAAPNLFFGPAPYTSAMNPSSTTGGSCGAVNPDFPAVTYVSSTPDGPDQVSLGFQGVYGHGIYACVPEK
jgi:hypothetical protein